MDSKADAAYGNACGGAGVRVPLCAAAVRQGRYGGACNK
jgi:hypothetical protein